MSKVAWEFTWSLDGFITGPDDDTNWLSTAEALDSDLAQRLAGAVGAILSRRRGYYAALAQASVGRQALAHDLVDTCSSSSPPCSWAMGPATSTSPAVSGTSCGSANPLTP
jgi:hypothetical protein